MAEPELIVTLEGGVGRLVLNRPRALNALSAGMIAGIHAALDAWRDDDAVVRVEIAGAGERGLCAGADVRALRDLVASGGPWLGFLAAEYTMNAAVAGFGKPYVAHQRGYTMGGGLGVSAHGTRRIAYPDSAFAMPETIIGFVPDVGVNWFLARAPGELGTHLALTGATINGTDAVAVGLADEVAGPAPPSVLARDREWIDACYAGDDPVEIAARLAAHADPRARATASDLRQRCPLAVAVALEAVRRARDLATVGEVLAQDLVLARHLIGRPDFSEGVRAQLVDRDRAPRWQHARLEDVTRAEVLACFA